MSEIRPCGDQQQLDEAVVAAAEVVGGRECIVLPTDTVYGIGCDAFSAAGVQALLGAKGRTREMPPPVLIARPEVMDALADQVSAEARALAEAFWPGALTIVCWAQPTLGWDLGETHGTVALRVPDDRVARAVLDRVGPMAVSSANRTGMPAALTAQSARAMLQDRVPLYLDDGPRPVASTAAGARDVASTIVDCTGETPVVLRHGAITLERLREVVPTVHGGAQESAQDAAAGTPADGAATTASAPAAGADGAASQAADMSAADGPGSADGVSTGGSTGSPDATGTANATAAAATVAGASAQTTAGASSSSASPGTAETPDARSEAGATDLARETDGGDVAPESPAAHGVPRTPATRDASDVSDEELITALVQDGAPTPESAVDQGRDRRVRPEPRWDGTSALSMADAERLVGE
ncbi:MULTISPECIES: L-threonylcarbamoyladenylate synthase [Kocuria]|uniref:L-threonylcarbamoyladenylate synthase n=3 Tax=Kocuria TaxID=57493 RepID=A0A7D7Q8P6_KOCVA|nr:MULTISPECIES: L-threonylcarbamoyladenylate synthase [Kocuria]QMS57463.1 Putative threonylcarbamoyl-AMP synthase [Kocuria varians]